MFSVDGLRANGFSGFQPLLELDIQAVPTEGGVYVVLADPTEHPHFIP